MTTLTTNNMTTLTTKIQMPVTVEIDRHVVAGLEPWVEVTIDSTIYDGCLVRAEIKSEDIISLIRLHGHSWVHHAPNEWFLESGGAII